MFGSTKINNRMSCRKGTHPVVDVRFDENQQPDVLPQRHTAGQVVATSTLSVDDEVDSSVEIDIDFESGESSGIDRAFNFGENGLGEKLLDALLSV